MKHILLLSAFYLCFTGTEAQISREQLRLFIYDSVDNPLKALRYPGGVRQFYLHNNYNPVWLQHESENNVTQLAALFTNAERYGLKKEEYPANVTGFGSGKITGLYSARDSMMAELKITDAALHFTSDFLYGNTKPAFGYYGLKYQPDCRDIQGLLSGFLANGQLAILPENIQVSLPEISTLNKKIQWLYDVMHAEGFKETTVTSAAVNSGNQALAARLYQLGILENENNILPDSTLKRKVKEAQAMFSLAQDGILNKATLLELNTPLEVRLKQLSFSVNYYRWLHCLARQQEVVVVNIPAAYLKVYKDNKINLEMKMVVGKPKTTTPTLASTINEVILYPYWNVPYKIATQELLPAIKRNPGYVSANNYQVLSSNGNIVNPYSVNWGALSTGYFPYTLRQSTGCDNALGLLKLNFYNPFSVYLHDTPSKLLFKQRRRYYSHGCMRMEKPMQLGHMVLKYNQIAIDTLEQKGCLRNQSPITVHADVHMPVIVWYNPAGTGADGRVVFFEDIYRKFNWR